MGIQYGQRIPILGNGLCMYAMHKCMFIAAFTTLNKIQNPPCHWDVRRAAGCPFPADYVCFVAVFLPQRVSSVPQPFCWRGMFPAGVLFRLDRRRID